MDDSSPMKDSFLYWFSILKRSVTLWLEGNAVSYAGSLAFFTLFSLAPVIILAVKVISLVMKIGRASCRERV